MASEVAPGKAPVMRLTTWPAVPKPGETVVSRAPKMWMDGHDCLAASCSASMGDPLTRREWTATRRAAFWGLGHILEFWRGGGARR